MATERDQVDPFDQRVDFPFWDGLGRGELRVQRCVACRAWRWPADWRCPECGSYDLGWEVVEATGTVYSWTRTRQAFVPAFADLVPYVNVLVELPQAGGARLLGLLVGNADERDVRIGASVIGHVAAPSERTLDLPALQWTLAGGAR
ncbi:Uncharacterized OB-fold protein, contains Zn-ribbon domain [Jatrophihabitans endophyticus]|uniref:Uncharacterized OB-fold protein, contains Zn-ribbon domain n=1 Tax=Jatrophihabitans endophyticus TaxID=1206085 RepID=A0A1M5PSY7_9ACTN|nr:OB-fold domain-containing protein [Jatrophihabitans endophyticus]SHH05057.1 Uncharacterized OB-fold protein, contains Zn-ribbon domain [Jatrophihabitans endophyticus]